MYQLFSRVRDGLKELATAFASYIKVSVGTYFFNTVNFQINGPMYGVYCFASDWYPFVFVLL